MTLVNCELNGLRSWACPEVVHARLQALLPVEIILLRVKRR